MLFRSHEGLDICQYTVAKNELKNGIHYIRIRYRDTNMEWSEWSEVQSFTVEGSIDGDPSIEIPELRVPLNSEFKINYQFAPTGTNAWIGVYHSGQKPGTGTGTVTSTVWSYTQGTSGELTFKLTTADEYFAVLFKYGGYEEASERIYFYAGPKIGRAHV